MPFLYFINLHIPSLTDGRGDAPKTSLWKTGQRRTNGRSRGHRIKAVGGHAIGRATVDRTNDHSNSQSNGRTTINRPNNGQHDRKRTRTDGRRRPFLILIIFRVVYACVSFRIVATRNTQVSSLPILSILQKKANQSVFFAPFSKKYILLYVISLAGTITVGVIVLVGVVVVVTRHYTRRQLDAALAAETRPHALPVRDERVVMSDLVRILKCGLLCTIRCII